jgi:hypothetical protein
MLGNKNTTSSNSLTDGNKNTASSNVRSGVLSADNIKIHTMQDDVDVLSGKTPIASVSEKINQNSFNSIFKTENKIKPINTSQKISESQPKEDAKNVVVQKNIPANLPVRPAVSASPIASHAFVPPRTSTSNIPPVTSPVVSTTPAPVSTPNPDPASTSAVSPKIEKKTVVSAPQIPVKKNSSKNYILLIASVILVFLIFAGGGYYFWMTRQPASEENISMVETTTTTTEAPPVIIEPQPEKFSVDKPNYLRIDTAIFDSEKMAALFAETAGELVKANISQPVEFLVVDEKNNPIEFAVFSLFSGIKMPKAITDNLNSFSIYFYSDSGVSRAGLVAKITEGKDISKVITQEEKNLVADLGSLQLEKIIVPEGKVFSSSTYRDVAIRYMNLNDQNTFSLDYAITDGQLIIGTSKNTMRAILDKLIQNKENAATNAAQSASQSEESTTTTTTDTTTTTIPTTAENSESGQTNINQ